MKNSFHILLVLRPNVRLTLLETRPSVSAARRRNGSLLYLTAMSETGAKLRYSTVSYTCHLQCIFGFNKLYYKELLLYDY